MIRRRSLFCNTLYKFKPSYSLYSLSDYPELDHQNCPACRTRGRYKPHGCYERNVVDFYGGKPVTLKVRISRVRCSSCKHTHALLLDTLIPYCQYSLRFILQVLKMYFRHSHTIEGICDLFQISAPTLYRWKRLFLRHRELWLGVLRSQRPSLSFLQFLDRTSDLSSQLENFFHRFHFSFLQSHANPAYS